MFEPLGVIEFFNRFLAIGILILVGYAAVARPIVRLRAKWTQEGDADA